MKTKSNLAKFVIVVVLVLSISLWAHAGYGENVKVSTSTYYTYNPKGKLDPFKPFIDTMKKAQKSEKSVLKSPLQKISIEQLKLVGIAGNNKKRVAIVEDLKGKHYHYILHKGTPVGMNEGRVVKILTDRVIVLERIESPAGKVKTKRIILKLRTEVSGGEL